MACSGMAVRRLAPYNLERSRDPETTRGQRHICNLRDAGATCSHVVVAPITWRAGYTTMTMTMITGVATDDRRRRFDPDARRRRRRSSDDDDRFTNDDSMMRQVYVRTLRCEPSRIRKKKHQTGQIHRGASSLVRPNRLLGSSIFFYLERIKAHFA